MARVTKRCSKCGKRKRRDKFSRCARNADGCQSWCKACRADIQRAYRGDSEVKERKNAWQRAYTKNPEFLEKQKKQQRTYRRKNLWRIRDRKRLYDRARCSDPEIRERKNAQMQAYLKKTPGAREKNRKSAQAYAEEHGRRPAAECLMCGLFFSNSLTYEWCHPATSARNECLDPSERGLMARPRRNDSVVWGWPRGGQNAAQREIRRKRRAG